LVAALGLSASSASADSDYVPGQVVVRYAPGASASDQAQALAAVDARASDRLPIPRAHLIDLGPGQTVPAAVARLNDRADVAYAEPNYVYEAARVPNDPMFGRQWAQLNTGQTFPPDPLLPSITGIPGVDMGAATAWDTVTGSPSVLVGVADSGVVAGQSDLEPNVRRDLSRDFRAFDQETNDAGADGTGHGTHVAGTIGAVGDNARGVAGVSWNPGIVSLRVLDAAGGGGLAGIAAGFAYAGEDGIPIVNASLGAPFDSQLMRDAINLAPKTLFVVAAGNTANNNDGPVGIFPCNIPADNLICVAATDPRDGLVSFSNYGSVSVDLGAPGTKILSTVPTFDTIRNAGFGRSDWTLSGRVWSVSGTTLDAAWTANQDETAELTGPVDLTGRTGCAALLRGTADMTAGEAGLFMERSTDGGVTWIQIASVLGSGPLPNLDLHADNTANVRLRFHWITLNTTGAHTGVSINRGEVRCSRGGDDYEMMNGTSMASPEVAGAAALLLARNPSLTVAQLRDALISTVTPVPALAGRTVTGGRINVAAAVAKVPPPPPSPPASGGSGGPGTGTTTSTPTSAPGTGPPLVPVTTPTTAAVVRLSGARTQNFLRARAVIVKVTVDRDAALSATGSITLGRARAAARLKLRAAKGQAVAGRIATLKLKLTARDLRKLSAAVRAKRRATANVSIHVTPADAPATVEKTSIRQKGT